MQLKLKKYLQDIVTSIESIENFTKGITKYVDFTSNRLVYRAVERELEIIAEAITRINKIDDSIEITNSKKIIGLRNRVIHSYDNINEDIVWGVVVNHLNNLKMEVEILMNNIK
jgi:uncharacterized protein with HEPN domain